ncbi:hypothetical protein CDL15_Pgr019232 [Punica granatum]|nr:hypothetical protein CDL15_Pgr019232 [Punica granatum]PKI73545.1 hypothetical protein CRG98_006126 [Punica granatum]
MYAFPKVPNSRIGHFNQPQGWFYCLPRFRQAFTPGPNYSALKEKLPIDCYGNSNLNAEKKFLVFDQSGDQTTVMVSSGPGTTFRCMTSWTLKQPVQPNMDVEGHGGKLDSYPNSGPTSGNNLSGSNEETDVSSEMHEDTEELNALLYSDDDDDESYYSEEDDEVTSTGHSPSTMTAHEGLHRFDRADKEEVASSAWPKKRKLNENDVEALDDTASSGDINGQSNYLSNDDYAESSCADRESYGFQKMGLPSAESKRIRREKIRETVGLLQEMIPGGKGKDAVVVLDEAIDYLKSLKVRANALGLAAL